MRHVVTTKRTARTWRPELVLASGPQMLAQTGDGSLNALYGRAWALALYRDGPQLFQEAAGQWEPRADGDALTPLTQYAVRHISFAFDQAARPVIAWELAGNVFVRQWGALEGGYVTRGPWPGRDPLLYSDAKLLEGSHDSDVLMFHLDGPALVVRAQREEYNTARSLLDVGVGAVLDQTTVFQHRIQILGERSDGSLLVAHSPIYPVQREFRLLGDVAVSGGYVDVLKIAQVISGVGVAVGVSGVLEQIIPLTAFVDTLSASMVVSGTLVNALNQVQVVEGIGVGVAISGALVAVVVPQMKADSMAGNVVVGGVLQ